VEELESVTAGAFDDKQTYTPEQSGYVFLVVRTTMENPTSKTQEIRFPKGPIVITDAEGQVYDLAGIETNNTFMMAPPYLPSTEFALSSTDSWAGGRTAVAYEPGPETWYIGATAGVNLKVSFVFVVPADASELVMRWEDGPAVSIP
jgi:hypothetical protein